MSASGLVRIGRNQLLNYTMRGNLKSLPKIPKNLWYDRQIRDGRDSVAVQVLTMQISTSKLFFCAPPCKWRSGQECQGLGYDTSGQTDILL